MPINLEQLWAGILEPVFAIRTENDLGVGDTECARQMIDWCARHRLSIFQTLPINETSDDNSPYNAISSQAIDPGTIAVSPELVPDLTPAKFAQLAPPAARAELRKGPVNYTRARGLKRVLLQNAFDAFLNRHWRNDTKRAGELRRFLSENSGWISDYALFRALVEENAGTAAWEQWPAEHRTPRDAHSWLLSLPDKRRDEFTRLQLFFVYVQWIAFSQWQSVKEHATRHGVFLMGDIPFGVGRCSADVWSNPDIFDLNWSGGAPPEKVFKVDPFTEKWGQNWGIPMYRWDEMARRNFSWWRMRVGNIQKTFHLYRIDHALGFFRIYSFPWTPEHNAEFLPLTEEQAAAKTGGRLPGFKDYPDDTDEHKAANHQRGEALLDMVLKASGDTTVIAEDLGVVPDYVPVTLRKLGIPGFRIPSFFREHDGRYCDPESYPRLSLTQPATHDHPPLAAAWADLWHNIDTGKTPDESRKELVRLMEFAGLKDEEPPRKFTDRLHAAYMQRIMRGNSSLVVVMITDLFGQTARFNTPGAVSAANWSTRMDKTVAELDQDPALRAKSEMFSRLIQETHRKLNKTPLSEV